MGAKKKVAIIGMGWLGNQVFKTLISAGYHVLATRRSNTSGTSIQYDIKNDALPEQLKDVDFAIISIPPFRSDDPLAYGRALANAVVDLNRECRIIFTSSTGVYPSQPGEYKEDFLFDDEDKNELYFGEEALISAVGNRLTILRLGGLIGVDRHPIKYLSGRKIAQGGNDHVALIDGRDVSNIISEILDDQIFGEIYNITYPIELSKRNYYAQIASKKAVEPPLYREEETDPRIVNNYKAESRFRHLFMHDLFGGVNLSQTKSLNS